MKNEMKRKAYATTVTLLEGCEKAVPLNCDGTAPGNRLQKKKTMGVLGVYCSDMVCGNPISQI